MSASDEEEESAMRVPDLNWDADLFEDVEPQDGDGEVMEARFAAQDTRQPLWQVMQARWMRAASDHASVSCGHAA